MNRSVWKAVRVPTVAVLLMGGALVLSSSPVQAAPAPDANSVLILDPTVTGGAGSREAVLAAANGFTVVVDSAAAWGARTMAEFGSFRAIILGDPTCVANPSPVAAAEANKAVWGPAINGNVIINGTDPVFHQGQGGDSLTEGSIKFAADEPTKTGAYISLSCYYFNAASGTPVPVLDPFGSFTVVGQGGCPAMSHIIAVHPALSGITDATLSNWGCSTHEGFVAWDPSFLVLAISLDVPSTFVAPDGTSGAPYILARGETLSPILCGNGILEGTEQCDDGNTTNGDGCSAQCTIEPVTGPTCNGLSPTTGCKVHGVIGACVGTSGNDYIEGTSGNDVIVGQGGSDLIKGFGGNDTLCGDDGNDFIEGGLGHDWIDGGGGNDHLKGQAGNDTIDGGAGTNFVDGGPGTDTCVNGPTFKSCP